MRKITAITFLIALIFLLAPFMGTNAVLVGNTTGATLSLSPSGGTYNVNDNFSVDINVNTHGENVVVVAAYLIYDRTNFKAVSIDTLGSVFTMTFESATSTVDATHEKIKITQAKPTPGVNTASGLVARVNFKALSATNPASDNFTFDFTPGSTLESNVIRDDGLGTDILSGVYNEKFIVLVPDTTPPTILAVNSDKANGSYTVGEIIDIDVTFSELVTSTGNVTVTLETGTTDRTCTFTVTNATTGTCNYTVQTGDTTGDLNVNTFSGTIRDAALNQMTNFIPVTNLSTNKNIIIDTTLPTITVGPVIINVTATSAAITWTTDEAATTQINYGLTAAYGSTTTLDSALVISHSQALSGLTASTLYHYRVRTKDLAGNERVSGDFTFTTLAKSDLNFDGRVNSVDAGILLSYWGATSRPIADINQDGYVNSVDVGIMMSQWTN